MLLSGNGLIALILVLWHRIHQGCLSQDQPGLQRCWISNGLLALTLAQYYLPASRLPSQDQPGLQKCWNGCLLKISQGCRNAELAVFSRPSGVQKCWIGNGLFALILILWYGMHQGYFRKISQDFRNAELVMACLHSFFDSVIPIGIKATFSRSVRAAEVLNW